MVILELVQSVAAPWLDVVALTLTNLGSEEAYIALLVVLYLGVDARSGRLLGLALLASYGFNQQAKAAFDTVRPYVLHPELLRGGEAAAGPVRRARAATPRARRRSGVSLRCRSDGVGRPSLRPS